MIFFLIANSMLYVSVVFRARSMELSILHRNSTNLQLTAEFRWRIAIEKSRRMMETFSIALALKNTSYAHNWSRKLSIYAQLYSYKNMLLLIYLYLPFHFRILMVIQKKKRLIKPENIMLVLCYPNSLQWMSKKYKPEYCQIFYLYSVMLFKQIWTSYYLLISLFRLIFRPIFAQQVRIAESCK